MTLTAETVGLYAETLVRQAAATGVQLDYSPESLGTLDGLLAGSDAQYAQASPAQRELVVFYAGCYLGEVLARELDAQWQFTPEWPQTTMIVAGEQGGVEIRPFQKLLRRLDEGSEGNHLTAYRTGIVELLSGQNV